MKTDTWFDRLLILLERMDTPRILLLRQVVNALADKRVAEDARSYPSLEEAIVDAAEGQERIFVRWRREHAKS